MRIFARAVILLAVALLVVWHGVVFSTPHNHADVAVPQEELACSASSPSSEVEHLHGAGRLLAPHPCLACLVGSTAAHKPTAVKIDAENDRGLRFFAAPADSRSSFRTHLPLLRGPPATT